jgi:hypothetical protein
LIAVQGYDYAGQLSVPDAIKELQIDYPVAHDESKAIWRAYGIRFRPSHALIGPDGGIADQGVGLVTTPAVKAKIEALLKP